MTCKDCLKNDVCGKRHKIEHPDENGVEYTCKNFCNTSGTNAVMLTTSPDSQDTGRCSECGSCCAVGDNYCRFCGGKIVGTEE